MKKNLARALALVLALMLPLSALAEMKVTNTVIMPKYSSLAVTAKVCYDYDKIYAPLGNEICGPYKSLYPKMGGRYFEVYNTSGMNNIGLIDNAGYVLLPEAYGDFEWIDDRWCLAYVLAPTDGDVGEYKDSNGNKYNISRADVVLDGKLIGSLTREDYTKSCSVYAKGAFLLIKQNSHEGFWLDSSFNRVNVKDDSYLSITEYTEVYGKGILHNPTQQYAFTATCTLTADQVTQDRWYDSSTGSLLDLQGNVLQTGLPHEYIRYSGRDYIVTKRGNMYGVMTHDGEEIIPTKYKEIPYSNGVFQSGYQACLDAEGRLYYLDIKGNVTASVEYKLDAGSYKGFYNNAPMVVVENMGQYLVITATHGELAEKYEDYTQAKGGHTILSVKKDGFWGAIDMAGNVVIPFVHRSSLTISDDGTLALGQNEKREYVLYHLESTSDAAPAQEEPAAEPAADASAPAEGWTCPGCKAVNTGKFCMECGSSKPVERLPDAYGWTCPDCKIANTGKFCPECGMPKPVEPEKVVCTGCGYEPAEGETPKFCPECGQKF